MGNWKTREFIGSRRERGRQRGLLESRRWQGSV